MSTDIKTNNLIARTVSANTAKSTENKQVQPVNNIVQETKTDSIELSTKNKSQNSSDFKNKMGSLGLGILVAGMFFLPDIIQAVKNKKVSRALDKYKNFKPLIGDVLTSQKQEQISKNRIKTTLEIVNGKFIDNEILIMNKNGQIKQRVLTRKEEMPDGSYMLRHMKSYEGNNLADNMELKKNPKKYLIKEYKRSRVDAHQSSVELFAKGKEKRSFRYYSTQNGRITFKAENTPKQKENVIYLYDNDVCVGTDTQVIDNITKEQYNILNIPDRNIHNKKYDLKAEGKQYEDELMGKFMANF